MVAASEEAACTVGSFATAHHSHNDCFPQMQTSSLAMASQMYMWEPANPTERADFEADLIASTNENNY